MAKTEEFSLSFLDTIACSFGGMILVFVMLALLSAGEGESDESNPAPYDGSLSTLETPRAGGGNARQTSPQLYLLQAITDRSAGEALKAIDCQILGAAPAMWVAKTEKPGQFLFFAPERSPVELRIWGGSGVIVQSVKISPQTKVARKAIAEINLPLRNPSDVLRYDSTAWSVGPANPAQ